MISDVDFIVNTGSSSKHNSKTIKTHGEWSIAFTMAKQACLFAYPHQADESINYEQFIIGQFTAQSDSGQHDRVIDLNKVIRLCITRVNYMFLTSFEHFNDLIMHHLITKLSLPSYRQAYQKRN